jgi:hypothetical protein
MDLDLEEMNEYLRLIAEAKEPEIKEIEKAKKTLSRLRLRAR